MKTRLEDRLKALRAEYDKGQQLLAEIQGQQAEIEQQLLRVSGAIQVLEELLSPPEPSQAETD